MAVYSYSRTSEIEALQGGVELDDKLETENLRLQTFALSRGMRVDRRYQDQGSKWSVNFVDRPQGTSLMNCLERGDIIIAGSLVRIFSSCEDMLRTTRTLKKMGVRLYIIDLGGDISDAEFKPSFATVMEVFNKLEKRRYTERIKTVKENQRRKGRFLGGSRPFGYMIHSNGRLIENPMEQRVLKKIFEMKNQGKSLRTISAEVSTPMMPISFKTVQRLLKRHAGDQESKQGAR